MTGKWEKGAWEGVDRDNRRTLSLVGVVLFEIRRADGSIPCGGAGRSEPVSWGARWFFSLVTPFVTRFWTPLEGTEARVVVVEAGMIFRANFSSEMVSSGDEGWAWPLPPPAQSMFWRRLMASCPMLLRIFGIFKGESERA